jgi:protein gp37
MKGLNGPLNWIGWCDYTWTPITGCLRGCLYCYVKRIPGYGDGVKFHLDRLESPLKLRRTVPGKSARYPWMRNHQNQWLIFVCSTADFFADWTKQAWRDSVLDIMRRSRHCIFQVLTKDPQNIPKKEWPDNIWMGTTVTCEDDAWRLDKLKEANARVRFVSFEPLLGPVGDGMKNLDGIDWIIIGPRSGSKKPGTPKDQTPFTPAAAWVDDLVNEARRRDIPVFVKNNTGIHEDLKELP